MMETVYACCERSWPALSWRPNLATEPPTHRHAQADDRADAAG